MRISISFLIVFIFGSDHLYPQKNSCEKANLLFEMMNKFHYSPPELNDSTSADIFKIFIGMMDPLSLYFLKSDMERLTHYKPLLDDENKKKNCSFLDDVKDIYRIRLHYADSLITDILSKPFDFTKKDTLFFSKVNKLMFAKDEKELLMRWENWLKYQALVLFFSSKNNNDRITSAKEILAVEEVIRKKILIKNKRFINRILDNTMGYENYVSSLYLNAITSRCDPHSMYFSSSQKEQFESGISTDALAYGISLKENPGGEVQIERLAPGSPAWKSNQLHRDDILLQIKWPGKEAVDLSFSSLGEVEFILQSSAFNEMELTVKKLNGLMKTVPLKKEKLRMDENLIKSYILAGKRKIGYLSLPGFYGDFENSGLPGCANDVAKEILKMDKEKIEGIILDLRFNGGGSLIEAVELAGIFIDEGPVCISSIKNQKPQLIKDSNRGTVYNGPLIIMVNGQSASASELLAAALQDYNRALIIGSPTFGKATGQVILPLDTSVNIEQYNPGKLNPEGDFVKVTIQKLYRITGKSHQQTGVIPDVILPEIVLEHEPGESNQTFALGNESISKKTVYLKLNSYPGERMSKNSIERTQSGKFANVVALRDSLKYLAAMNRKISLEKESFHREEMKVFEMIKRSENNFRNASQQFHAGNNMYDLEIFKVDLFRKEINDFHLKNINEDIYIDEAFRIMDDLISFGNEK